MKLKTYGIILSTALMMTVLPSRGAEGVKELPIKSIKIGGHVGARIDDVIAKRIMSEDVDAFVNVFRTHKETHLWQSEFWGKWAIGAAELYAYSHDPALYSKLKHSVEGIISTQDKDGYIGNYAPEAQLKEWDIWGRKYVIKGLLAWYDVSGDKKALSAACREMDFLMRQLKEKGISIVKTGNYRGMPSASILNAVVALYHASGKKQYLDFAQYIVKEVESSYGPQLIAKAEAGVPVSRRFPSQGVWWGYANGQKAYEMMSVYQGMLDLYDITGDKALLSGTAKAVEQIISEEINIAGAGSMMECWYGGKARQTRPAADEMETCVTVTWITLLERMLRETGESRYADLLETTVYNALLSSLKRDGSQIDKYTPLEGRRIRGEQQCGLAINCCNANGPRGFAAIPRLVYTTSDGSIFTNLYIPSKAEIVLKGSKTPIMITQSGDYPLTGEIALKVSLKRPAQFRLALRRPEWSKTFSVTVNGSKVEPTIEKGYAVIDREWRDGDVVALQMDMRGRVVRLNGCDAIVRGPVVLARDKRFGDGDVDEVVSIADKDGYVDLKPAKTPDWAWMSFVVPAVAGVDRVEHAGVVDINLCDFSSTDNMWESDGRYRVWLPEAITDKNFNDTNLK